MKSKLCNSAIKRSTFVHKQTQDSANPFGQLLQYDVGCVGTIYSSQEPITRSEQLPCAHVMAFLRTSLSRSSERILIWYSCGTRAEIFELSRATADQPPLLILSGPSRQQETGLLWQGRGWTRFRDLVSFSCRCHARRLRRTRIHKG